VHFIDNRKSLPVSYVVLLMSTTQRRKPVDTLIIGSHLTKHLRPSYFSPSLHILWYANLVICSYKLCIEEVDNTSLQ